LRGEANAEMERSLANEILTALHESSFLLEYGTGNGA
jgi:hypothetical protein